MLFFFLERIDFYAGNEVLNLWQEKKKTNLISRSFTLYKNVSDMLLSRPWRLVTVFRATCDTGGVNRRLNCDMNADREAVLFRERQSFCSNNVPFLLHSDNLIRGRIVTPSPRVSRSNYRLVIRFRRYRRLDADVWSLIIYFLLFQKDETEFLSLTSHRPVCQDGQ